MKRKWPLISPSPRLLPQPGAKGLLEDAKAAYTFARNWDTTADKPRPVISVGASGGFFLACQTAHHCNPPPIALLSIEGINTFHHKFFNSSTLLTPEPIKDSEVAEFITGDAIVGVTPSTSTSKFYPEKLLADFSKNADFVAPKGTNPAEDEFHDNRGLLYDYYTYNNAFIKLLGETDPGYDWAVTDDARRKKWPQTVIFHGNDDYDVELDVSEDMKKKLGDRVDLFIAEGKPHLFERALFLEDDDSGMKVVREAIARLDEIVSKA